MVTLAQLWLPILLSAVFVFLASSVIHMALKYHNPDYRRLPNEDEVRAAVRQGNAAPGQYIVPHCLDPKAAASEAMLQKFREGPVAVMWLRPPGVMGMGACLMQWFVYSLAVSVCAGYVASRTLVAGSAFTAVLRIGGAAAFLAYAGAKASDSIWKGKPWAITVKETVDGLIYGLITGATLGWMWPEAS
jgi:hypothetical protein